MRLRAKLAAIEPQQWAFLWQIARYLVTGGFVTAVQAALYWTLAARAGLHPQISNLIGYVAAVILGYLLHGRITFRGQDRTGSAAARLVRFVAVSLVSLALNALWVAIMTTALKWPEWTPIPLMVLVTPAVVFLLNRQWVFR